MFFKCKHPAAALAVDKGQTIEPSREYPEEYQLITFHFTCLKCLEPVRISHARLRPEIAEKEEKEFQETMERSRKGREEFAAYKKEKWPVSQDPLTQLQVAAVLIERDGLGSEVEK